jgi:hypothetical protein
MVSHTLFVTEYGKDWPNGGDVGHHRRFLKHKAYKRQSLGRSTPREPAKLMAAVRTDGVVQGL